MEADSNPVRKHEYQLTAADTSRSEEQLHRAQVAASAINQESDIPKVPRRPKVIMASAGLASVVSILYLLWHHYITITLIPNALENTQYKFQIYCPINKITHHSLTSNISHQFKQVTNDLRFLTQQLTPNSSIWPNNTIDQYVIYIQMRRISNTNNISKLFFCSYVTDWDQPNCSYATPICTVPGAILYAQRNKPIQVAWVYNIENTGDKHFSLSYTPCMNLTSYNQSQYKSYCTLQQRKPGYESCTYLNPTEVIEQPWSFESSFLMSPLNIPVVTHIHGLAVRPTLDGNPMAWVGKGGETGIAFQSLLNGQKYFNNSFFKDDVSTTFLKMPKMNHTYAKVNRYENRQLPGNLWYHDHAMHITQDNVGHGLLGDYIIYDPVVDAQMPSRKYDIFIVAGQHMAKNEINETDSKVYAELRNNPRIPFFTQSGIALMRNQTYRIRLLNGMFDAVFSNLRFMTDCQIVSGQKTDPATCRKILQFTVIGSDSAMFNTPVNNVTNLTISSAERFELLIIFDGNIGNLWQNPISAHSNRVLLVDDNHDIKHEFVLLPKTSIPNHYNKLPCQLTIIKGVDFYDLTQVNQLCADVVVDNPTKCITMMRMRPIFKKNGVHFFNGHYDFARSGQTDNPKIGTTEDWVFISLTHRHPIHVHLINFQIIGTTTLKNYTVAIGPNHFHCTFYQMDYWVAAGVIPPSNNLTQLCLDSLNVNILDKATQKILDKAFPENKVNADNSSVSGFDVFQLIKTPADEARYNTQTNCVNQYKYICGPVTNKLIPEEYRRWKEVGLVDNRTVMVMRIRWASTDYLVNGKGSYPYFPLPEDQLIEYPGYVYHCHFLQHEDNKLMRPFQMYHSDQFGKHFNMSGTPMGDCMIKKGFKPWDGWLARYKCMNQLSGCPDAPNQP